jgi:atypical dual specificity phosphatase
MPWNFSFVIDGCLAGMAHPGLGGRVTNALEYLVANEVRGIVSLTWDPNDAEAVVQAGMKYLHLPVQDFCPPTLDQVDEFVSFVMDRRGAKEAAVVHCAAGMGRTGTMLACFLVSDGTNPGEAIRQIRQMRPGSIETSEQEELIQKWAARVSGAADDDEQQVPA